MLYTNYIEYELFNKEELDRIDSILEKTTDSDWEDGLESTTHNSRNLKNNIELKDNKHRKAITNIIKKSLSNADIFKNFVFPIQETYPIISKSKIGNYYNLHIDSVSLGEFSTSVFLSEKNSYEGGELSLYVDNKEKKIKLKKGHAITYRTGIPHKVNEITKGERIAIVFWNKTLFENDIIRDINYKLDILYKFFINTEYNKQMDFEDIDKNPFYVIKDIQYILKKNFSVKLKK